MKKLLTILLLTSLTGCGDVIEKASDIIDILNKPSKKQIVQHLGSANCLKEYYDYSDYSSNKAFATSSDESCGWSGSHHETIEAAKKEAVEYCEQNRKGGTPCKVVDVNGRWL